MLQRHENAFCLALCSCRALLRPDAGRSRHGFEIRTEATEHSQVGPVFDMFTITIGPRLTASPAHKRAAEYAREGLASYGLNDTHLEPWHFGRRMDHRETDR
jgi:hypothetical protein